MIPDFMLAGTLGTIVMGTLVIAAILWVLLPFAVFGVKDRLERISRRQTQTNQLLTDILTQLRASAAAPHCSKCGATVASGDSACGLCAHPLIQPGPPS